VAEETLIGGGSTDALMVWVFADPNGVVTVTTDDPAEGAKIWTDKDVPAALTLLTKTFPPERAADMVVLPGTKLVPVIVNVTHRDV
jgi:hypothetical protein